MLKQNPDNVSSLGNIEPDIHHTSISLLELQVFVLFGHDLWMTSHFPWLFGKVVWSNRISDANDLIILDLLLKGTSKFSVSIVAMGFVCDHKRILG